MKFTVAVFLLAAAVQVYALPTGAPSNACPNLFPVELTSVENQVSNPTDNAANPYQLSLQGFFDSTTSSYRYYPGGNYTRILSLIKFNTGYCNLISLDHATCKNT